MTEEAAESASADRHPADFAEVQRQCLAEVGWLPGVTRVLTGGGTPRRFRVPGTRFQEGGTPVRVWVSIGVDRYEPVPEVIGLVSDYLRARLRQLGFTAIDVQVRVALLE